MNVDGEEGAEIWNYKAPLNLFSLEFSFLLNMDKHHFTHGCFTVVLGSSASGNIFLKTKATSTSTLKCKLFKKFDTKFDKIYFYLYLYLQTLKFKLLKKICKTIEQILILPLSVPLNFEMEKNLDQNLFLPLPLPVTHN